MNELPQIFSPFSECGGVHAIIGDPQISGEQIKAKWLTEHVSLHFSISTFQMYCQFHHFQMHVYLYVFLF